MKLFCKHDWKLISEELTESKLQHAKSLGIIIKAGYSTYLDRKYIQVYSCKICGKIKKFVETI